MNARISTSVLVALILTLTLSACAPAAASTDRCDTAAPLAFDTDAARTAPALNCFAGCILMSVGDLGRSGANSLSDSLQPTDTFCALPVSPEISTLIQQVDEKHAQKDDAGALDLLRGAASAPDATTAQISRDALALAGAAESVGGNPQIWIDPAAARYQEDFPAAVSTADLNGSLRMAQEAALLGLTTEQNQALARARQLSASEMTTAVQDFLACGANQTTLEGALRQVQVAALLGVDAETRSTAETTIKPQVETVVKRLMNSKAQACQLTGSFNVIYAKVVSPQGTPIQVQVTIPFTADLTQTPYTLHGEGQLNGQNSLALSKEVALVNAVDMTVVFDGVYHPSNTDTPIHLQFVIRGNDNSNLLGQSNAVSQLELPPNWTDVTYDLNFPLQDGALLTAGKSWGDTHEWTFVLHLTAQPTP
ncbi:MAG: hypothetical protein ABFD44_05710 [Anaerolineaceae bacterium]